MNDTKVILYSLRICHMLKQNSPLETYKIIIIQNAILVDIII
jgi:hypothetical protein